MNAFLDVMENVNTAAFCLLAVACAAQWWKHRDPSIRWATAAFSSLAGLSLLGLVLEQGSAPTLSLWLIKGILLILCLFPYLLYRFAVAFQPPSRAVRAVANVSAVAVAAFTVALPSVPLPIPGLPVPLWWTWYRMLILAQWTVLFAIVAVRMWGAGAQEATVSRYRMRTLAFATVGLDAAILLSGVGPEERSPVLSAAVAVLLLISSTLFFVGLAPPRWLVQIWRQPEQLAVQAGMGELFLAESTAAVCAALLPHTRLIGARGAALVSPSGTVVGQFGMTDAPERVAAMAVADGPPPVGLLRIELQAGSLLVWRSRYAPFFARGDIEALEALGHFADIVMDRCALVEAQRVTKMELAFQATHDHLTGLPNRLLLHEHLTRVLQRATDGSGVAVLFLDIDRFKGVNDSLGHSLGDDVLRAIACRLRRFLRPSDMVARFGGDEFVVIAEGPFEGGDARCLARRIADCLTTAVEVDGTEVVVTVSTGLAIAQPGDDAETLLRNADAAMYGAKDGGRDQYVVFDDQMRGQADRRVLVESALRRAIDLDELSVRYQPMVELASGRVTAIEALARCEVDGEELQPDEFIPIAEESGLIVPLGSIVLRQACAQVAAWQRAIPGLERLTVSVNRSARELLMPGAAQAVAAVLADAGLQPGHLCLEITESVLLEDAVASARALGALKGLGVSIAVDDFGTGYSSLTYLKQFPVDMLKIDRSFVAGLGAGVEDPGDRAIVAGVIDLAHAFGLTAIAEGVESEPQLERLRMLGCELAQGFLLGTPMKAEQMTTWLRDAHAEAQASPLATLPERAPVGCTRVLVVDDDRTVRTLLSFALGDDPAFDLVATATDGREGIAMARHHQPDLVLLDLAMPGIGGLEALPLIRAVAPSARVVIVSGLDAADVGAEGRAHGADGFVSKGLPPERIVADLHRVLAGPEPAPEAMAVAAG